MTRANTVAILTSRDERRMRALAQDEACSADALVVLSQSLSSEIRASVARNSSTPKIADEMLSADEDALVRSEIARKVAKRAAIHPGKISEKIRTAALQILTRMIADQEIRVRQVIAEEIKTSHHVPKQVADKLARDEADSVSGPVLEYSPLLTDEDLIDIIAGYIHSPALEAVARRSPLSEDVAGKLVDVLDTNSIAALLRNPDANIREDALEKIIEAAREVEEWHQPLVKRPSLSARAIQRICSFVTETLMGELAQRPDVDEDTRTLIEQKVSQRLESENASISDEEAVISEIRDELLVRMKMGKLNSAYLTDAATSGKHTVVSVGLSLLTEVDHITVRRAFMKGDSKTIAALCWKAGLPMPFARLVQELIGKIDPADCLEPDENGNYPIKESTLEWTIILCLEENDANQNNSSGTKASAA